MSSGRVMIQNFQQEEQPVLTINLIINEKKEGIVSILGSDDCERIRGVGASSAAAASLSLRRTLSADMSSKKWLAQNGFRPIMKRIASSEELPISSASSFSSSSSSSEGEEDQEEELQRPGQDEVWMSIQSQKQKEKQVKANSNGWTWGSILTQKNDDDNEGESKQTPYIHPLVKRSSSLSEKSLEICTESLGSETGSDGFSSNPPSEAGDVDEEKQQSQQQQQQQSYNDNNNNNSSFMEEDLGIISVNYNYNNRKLMQSRSFPPPLPSLAAREDGASLHMNCHRHNGRLVLEAVSVPSQNYFHAQRQDGRLLLTLINNPSSPNCDEMEEEDEAEEYARVFDNIEEEIEDEIMQDEDGDDDEFEIEAEEEEQMEEKIDSKRSSEMEYYVPEQISRFERGGGGGGVGVGLMNVHKSALVMKKVIAINNNNLTWSPNLNKSVNRMIEFEEEEEGGEDGDDEQLTAQIPQSLPPPPRLISTAAPPAAAASFNAYEYFWRQQKPSVANIIKQMPPPPPQQQSLKNKEMINHHNDASAAAARNSKGNHYHHRHHEHNNAEYNLVRRCNETRKSLLLWGEPHCIAT